MMVPVGTNQATLTNGIVDGVEMQIAFKSLDVNGHKSAGFTLHITPRTGPIGLHFIATAAGPEAIGTLGFSAGDYYVPSKDVDLNAIDWSSVGPTTTFSGVFDGNGYTVANLTASSSGGLFPTARGALVARTVLDNVDVSGGASVGGIVGHGSGVSIVPCRWNRPGLRGCRRCGRLPDR